MRSLWFSVGQLIFDCRSYCGLSRRMQGGSKLYLSNALCVLNIVPIEKVYEDENEQELDTIHGELFLGAKRMYCAKWREDKN